MKPLVFLFTFLFFSCRVFAQQDTIVPAATPAYFIGGSYQYGFLWTHRYNMGHLVKKHIVAGELDFYKTTTGVKAWNQPYHFPTVGFALHVVPLGNPEELGTAVGFYPFINFPLGDRKRNLKM